MMLLRWGIVSLMLSFAPSLASAESAYVGEEKRQIKAMSAQEIEGYLAGRGMGLARAAELNGYPGPLHVLDLADELKLTPAQKQRTQSLFGSMQSKAKALGRALVEEERKLDGLFAAKTVTPESLEKVLTRIADLQAQLRQTHLDAHLAQARILAPAQISRYAKLRGYAGHHGGHAH